MELRFETFHPRTSLVMQIVLSSLERFLSLNSSDLGRLFSFLVYVQSLVCRARGMTYLGSQMR
jgi:hypothetical protein